MFKTKEEFIASYRDRFKFSLGKSFEYAGKADKYNVLIKLLNWEFAQTRSETLERYKEENRKQIFYFSMEFLVGRLLNNYLISLGIDGIVREGLADLGEDLDDLLEFERDPGLGNGGLGRLSACFLDSMACLDIAGYGCGLRYKYGLFRQKIQDGRQLELPDDWLSNGYPWEMRKPESSVTVKFFGKVDYKFINNEWKYEHIDYESVKAVPYDVPIAGFKNDTINYLRLWDAEPEHDNFDLGVFNQGNYNSAVAHRSNCEAITTVLYPNDSNDQGKLLRLKQEYFLVAAGIGSIMRDYRRIHGDFLNMPEYISIHINDTHPAMVIPELMRILIDDEHLDWETAWKITTGVVSFTNHTILPEALEKWRIDLFRSLLPRIYTIVEEIDRRYRESISKLNPGITDILRRTAILWDGQIRMANLCVIGSYAVNGVAAMHSDILKTQLFSDFNKITPQKFHNKTNGVSHRRFLIEANPKLTALINSVIGEQWQKNPMLLKELLQFENDEQFLKELSKVKHQNKLRLSAFIGKRQDTVIDPYSVFDVQVKRIHAYKRQLLNLFKVMALYNDIRDSIDKGTQPLDIPDFTIIIGGKAAQSYTFAKNIIKLTSDIADKIASDPAVSSKLKLVFFENFSVSSAQLIYPAADISEQISTAGFEASGTGNMKFMFNGALTLGTLDGANVEIKELAGDDNITIFGMKEQEIADLRAQGKYLAYQQCNSNPALKRITEQLASGFWSEPHISQSICDEIFHSNDFYLVLKDFEAYMEAWHGMAKLYGDKCAWAKKSLHNIAKAGFFTSDRTIAQYAEEVWKVKYDKTL